MAFSFIHKYLLSTCYVPSTVLGAQDIVINLQDLVQMSPSLPSLLHAHLQAKLFASSSACSCPTWPDRGELRTGTFLSFITVSPIRIPRDVTSSQCLLNVMVNFTC